MLIAYCFLLVTPAFAQENIGSSRLSPENPLYFLKAVREKLEIQFAGTEKVRILKRLEFAERRLKEVNSLIAVHREDLIAPNMEKFLLELTLIKPAKDKYIIPTTVSNSLGYYMQALVGFYNSLTDPKAKLGVRSTIYRLMDLIQFYYGNMTPELASQIFPLQETKFLAGCNLLAREALSQNLSESERQILKERGAKCEQTLLILQ